MGQEIYREIAVCWLGHGPKLIGPQPAWIPALQPAADLFISRARNTVGSGDLSHVRIAASWSKRPVEESRRASPSTVSTSCPSGHGERTNSKGRPGRSISRRVSVPPLAFGASSSIGVFNSPHKANDR